MDTLNDIVAITPQPGVVSAVNAIVLAIDGGTDSDHAIDVAGALSEQTGASVRVVSVAERMLTPAEMPTLVPMSLAVDPTLLRSAQRARVEMQLDRHRGRRTDWTVAMRTGVMGLEVAEFARAAHADVIIVGRGRHGMLDRLLGEEHLARLLSCAEVPVLAVEDTAHLPAERVVLGVDFSNHSVDVARSAAPYIGERASVYLVHVKPDPPFGLPHPGQWIKSYEDGVRAGLEQMRAQLSVAPGCTVETVVLNGHPGVALADYARAAGADLVAVGIQGAGFWNRLVIGSVTNYLLRAAPCSILAVPRNNNA